MIASVIQPNEGITGVQEKFVIDTFFSDNEEKQLKPLQHQLGLVSASKEEVEPSSIEKLGIIRISSGLVLQ